MEILGVVLNFYLHDEISMLILNILVRISLDFEVKQKFPCEGLTGLMGL